MKTNKKVLGLLAIACVGAATLGAASLNGAVEAKAETPSAFSTFAMEDGASIYVGDTQSATAKEGNGIRWQITMNATQYAALSSSGYTDIKFGILVAPEEGYDLTEETVFGDEAIYDWAEKQPDGSYVYSGNKTRIANFYTDELYEPENVDNADYVEFYGALTNLKDGADEGEDDTTNNLSRMFQGKGYIEYKDDGVTKYVWVGDADNVRSMAYVAQLAIADEEVDAPTAEVKTWLGDNYIAKAPNVNWYIEHYLQKDDGTYETTAHNTTTHTGAPSATASAYNSPITVDGYHMNELKTECWQGFVWANNSTKLKLYYEKNDLSVNYGDYQVSFVQNDYRADAMENKIVDGKLVTVVGDSILDSQNEGIGNIGDSRPQLVISGLNAGELYTVNATVSTTSESFQLVPYKEQGLAGNNYYGIFNEGEEKTFTASNLVADENGQISFGSWYGSMGTYTWESVVVTSDEPVVAYGDYQVRYLKDNSLETVIMTSRVNDEGKMVTTTSASTNNTGARAALVVSGLTPYHTYSFTLGISSPKDVYAYYGEFGGGDWFQCWSSSGTGTGTRVIQADANGEYRDESLYISEATTITWDTISFTDLNVDYGNGVTTFFTIQTNDDRVTPSVEGGKFSFNNGTKGIGNNRSSATTCALWSFSGLEKNKAVTLDVTINVTHASGATMVFSTSGNVKTYFKFVSGTTTDGTNKAGANINTGSVLGEYVIRLTGTTDENGQIVFNGLYLGANTTITVNAISVS